MPGPENRSGASGRRCRQLPRGRAGGPFAKMRLHLPKPAAIRYSWGMGVEGNDVSQEIGVNSPFFPHGCAVTPPHTPPCHNHTWLLSLFSPLAG